MTIPKALALEIVTPDRPIVTEEVDEVQLPGWDGALGILPGHTPLLAMLRPGELWYRKGSERSYVVLDFGMAEVLPDRVTVMVRLADRPEEIDVERQERERREAEEEMRQARTEEDAERARIAMLTAMMKLRAAERVRMKRGL
ncbi:MAG TPA: F0F1 ATP synthase subunit epsilon [Vicinamibacterales bacterium]